MPEPHESHSRPHEPPAPPPGVSLAQRLREYLKKRYGQEVGAGNAQPGAQPQQQHTAGTVDEQRLGPGNAGSLRDSLNESRAAQETARQLRPAEIPRSLDEQKSWEASPQGQAWKARIEEQMPPAIKAALDSPESQSRRQQTDEMRERLREEMIARQAQGDPMTVSEYEDRFTDGMREVGQRARDEESERKQAGQRADAVYDLNTVEEMQSHGERWSTEYEQDYTQLRDDIGARARHGEPMSEQEYGDRLDRMRDKDQSRDAETPPTIEELKAWRESPDGRAEAAELAAYAKAEKQEYAPIDQEKFDAAYEQLRNEVVERKAAGDPMSSREYRHKHETALEDAGQSWKVADWQTARAELRSIGEAPTREMAERNPPQGQLKSIARLERDGEHYSDEYKVEYQKLYDETSSLNADRRQMPEAELERRLDAIYDEIGDREAAIPPTLEEMREWRESADGRAEAQELKIINYRLNDGQEIAPIDQKGFDAAYEKLREEMVDRKAAGNPMSNNEFERRHEDAAMDAGQTHQVARWETQRTHRRAEAAEPEREPGRGTDRAGPEPGQRTQAPGGQRVGDTERSGPSAANGRPIVIGADAPMPASAPAPAAGSSQSQSRQAPSRQNDATGR